MKRTALTRRTPLRSKTGLRRTSIKPWRRKPETRTDAVERAHVLLRDQFCIAIRHDSGHVCWDHLGQRGPRAIQTVDHVHDHAGGTLGKRAPCGGCAPDKRQAAFMVRLCEGLNVAGPSAKLREFERRYLRDLEAKGRL